MKNIVIIISVICTLALSVTAYAYDPNRPLIWPEYTFFDNSAIEVMYNHDMFDPESKREEDQTFILQAGKKASKYTSYGKYQHDSLSYKHKNENDWTWGKYIDISKNFDRPATNYVILNRESNELIHLISFAFEYYYYNEPIPKLRWTMVADSDTLIAGHHCAKATTNFRGRDWTAWYTEEIPIDAGPYKFSGLPGLILEVEDSNCEHQISAIAIRRGGTPIVKCAQSMEVKLDRKKFNEEYRKFMKDPLKYIQGSPLEPKGPNGGKIVPQTASKRFANYIEKD